MLKRLFHLQKLQSAHHTFIFVAKNTLFSTFYKYWGKKLVPPIAQTHSRQSESIRTAYPLELHFTPISTSFKQKIIPSMTQFSIYNYFFASHALNFIKFLILLFSRLLRYMMFPVTHRGPADISTTEYSTLSEISKKLSKKQVKTPMNAETFA